MTDSGQEHPDTSRDMHEDETTHIAQRESTRPIPVQSESTPPRSSWSGSAGNGPRGGSSPLGSQESGVPQADAASRSASPSNDTGTNSGYPSAAPQGHYPSAPPQASGPWSQSAGNQQGQGGWSAPQQGGAPYATGPYAPPQSNAYGAPQGNQPQGYPQPGYGGPQGYGNQQPYQQYPQYGSAPQSGYPSALAQYGPPQYGPPQGGQAYGGPSSSGQAYGSAPGRPAPYQGNPYGNPQGGNPYSTATFNQTGFGQTSTSASSAASSKPKPADRQLTPVEKFGPFVPAFLIFIAALLTWATFKSGSQTVALNGVGGNSNSSDPNLGGAKSTGGWLTIVLALGLAGLATAAILGKLKGTISAIVTMVLSALVLLVALIQFANVSSVVNSSAGKGYSGTIGIGVWLTLFGSLVGVGLGVMAFVTARKRERAH